MPKKNANKNKPKSLSKKEEPKEDDSNITTEEESNKMNSFDDTSSDGSVSVSGSDSDSDEVSDVSDESEAEYEDESHIGDNASKTNQSKFFENVIKYLQTDDLIKKKQKEHRDEIKDLKDEKTDLEAYILRYLDRAGEDTIDVGGKCTLTKSKTETKASIKSENIREGILEGLQKEKLVQDDQKTIKIINDIMDLIEGKRTVNTRTFLKRNDKKKNKAKGKGKGKGAQKDK